MSSSDALALLRRIAEDVSWLRSRVEARDKRRDTAEAHDFKTEVSDFVTAWNQTCPGLPQVRSVKPGTPRYASIVRALKAEPEMKSWERAMAALYRSEWHRGQNERGWVATIDFLVSPGQFQKWLDAGTTLSIPRAVVPRTEPVWCATCGNAPAIYGPGTKNKDQSEAPACAGCWKE